MHKEKTWSESSQVSSSWESLRVPQEGDLILPPFRGITLLSRADEHTTRPHKSTWLTETTNTTMATRKFVKTDHEASMADEQEEEKPGTSVGTTASTRKLPPKILDRKLIDRKRQLRYRAERKKEKKLERKRRKEEAEALGENAPPKQVPHTLETLREKDDTMVGTDDTYEDFEIQTDEFAPYFRKDYVPKIIITSSHNPTLKTRLFLKELERVVPNSEVFLRRNSTIKKMVEQAVGKGYTDIMVINEDQKEPTSLLVSHLPEGPTCFFKLTNVKLTKHIKRDWREITSHRPEILTTNFRTRIGVVIARMFGALFHQEPEFKGRRVVTFHNQRDYIFVRHHRYEFKKEGEKAALRELGPRFTLKLRSIQKGTFDSKTGEYEWIITNKRHQLEKSRRRFYL